MQRKKTTPLWQSLCLSFQFLWRKFHLHFARPKPEEPKRRHIHWEVMQRNKALPCLVYLQVFQCDAQVVKKNLKKDVDAWQKRLKTPRSCQAWLLRILRFIYKLCVWLLVGPGNPFLNQANLDGMWPVPKPPPHAGDWWWGTFYVHHVQPLGTVHGIYYGSKFQTLLDLGPMGSTGSVRSKDVS